MDCPHMCMSWETESQCGRAEGVMGAWLKDPPLQMTDAWAQK